MIIPNKYMIKWKLYYENVHNLIGPFYFLLKDMYNQENSTKV
jgi:hypothetical protein